MKTTRKAVRKAAVAREVARSARMRWLDFRAWLARERAAVRLDSPLLRALMALGVVLFVLTSARRLLACLGFWAVFGLAMPALASAPPVWLTQGIHRGMLPLPHRAAVRRRCGKSAFRRVEAGGRGALSRERAQKMGEFKSGLAKIVGNPCVGLRPFVCDGSPLDCKVFLVGINPATKVHRNFWCFWKDASGFNKEEWLVAYRAARKNAGKRENSPSREIIEQIVKSADSIACLETNLFPEEVSSADYLRDEDPSAFKFLLQEIQPRVIAVFASEKRWKIAHQVLDVGDAKPRPLPEGFGGQMFQRADGVRVVFMPHYVYQRIPWDNGKACEFGRWLRDQAGVQRERGNPAEFISRSRSNPG